MGFYRPEQALAYNLDVENQELRTAIEKAIKILDRNLGHQTEKCYDAVSILKTAIKPQ